MSGDFTLEVSAATAEVPLPHECPDGTDAPIPYAIGPRGRDRLSEGESVPVTARCRRCDGRAFFSLVDPAARTARLASVRPDPTALRAPATRPGAGARPPLRLIKGMRPTGEPCPACGVVPDASGICRCSA